MRVVYGEHGETGRAAQTVPEPIPFRTLSVLMPVYNERATLPEIVERVLNAPVPLAIELIIVDDGSCDGSWEVVQELAAAERRIQPIRHPCNCGKGTALRTAIQALSGEVAVVQDADLEYDPADYPRLLAPILEGKADAVFGTRFAGYPRRVLSFWHGLVNRGLTLFSSALTNLALTDMETCYKMVRADLLKRLRLRSKSFTFEPELTCRLAQWGARIYEVPVSYNPRTREEGKKIGLKDGFRAIGAMLYYKFFDPRFTEDSRYYRQMVLAKAQRHHQWLLDLVRPYLGQRLLEVGAGIGSRSRLLLDRERLVLADSAATCVDALQQRFFNRRNVRVDWADPADTSAYHRWRAERLDTILGAGVLEHASDDEAVLKAWYDSLVPGGRCVLIVPATQAEHHSNTDTDSPRRYTVGELEVKLRVAGFDIIHIARFGKLGGLGWPLKEVGEGRGLGPTAVAWLDRFLPVARLLDRALPLGGRWLMMVGEKPRRSAERAAA